MFDSPWIILLIVAASIVRWLWQKAVEEKEKVDRPVVPDQPIPRSGESQSEEDRIRRFLEALGQPPGTTPPPKIAPKRWVPPTVFSPLPPLTTVPPPLPVAERIFKPAIVQETEFEVRDVAMQSSSEPSFSSRPTEAAPSGLRAKLASSQGLRDAIILREIFGPPRSLQPIDLVSSV